MRRKKFINSIPFYFIMVILCFMCKNISLSKVFTNSNPFFYTRNLSLNYSKYPITFIFFHDHKKYQDKYSRKIQSQKIVINGINNSFLQHKLLMLMDINISQKDIIPLKEIKHLSNKMKLSGFFTHVELTSYMKKSHQVILINVVMNSILKTISVTNYKDKLISYSYIWCIFRDQLGKPMNFMHIKHNADLLKQWYHDRGYTSAEVIIKYDNSNYTNINIDIFEGVINKIDIVACSKGQQMSNLKKALPTTLILNIIHQKPGERFNLHHLERGILHMKNQKLISQCQYEIIYDVCKTKQVKLILYVELTNSRSTHMFSKKVSIAYSLIESAELLVDYSLNHLLGNQEHYHLVTRSQILTTIHNFIITSCRLYHTLYLPIYNYDYSLYPILSQYSSYRQIVYKLNEWYLTQMILIAGDNFGFRHYMRYLGKDNSNIMIDASFPKSGPSVTIKYQIPYNQKFSSLSNYISFCVKYITYVYNNHNVPILLSQDQKTCLHYKNLILKDQSFSLILYHFLTSSLITQEELDFKNMIHESILLQNKMRFSFLANHDKMIIQRNNISYSSFIKKWVHNMYSFFRFKVFINYNLFHKIKTQFSPDTYTLEFIHIIPYSKTNYKKTSYGTKIIYKMKKSLQLSKNIMVVSIKFINLIGNFKCLPLSEEAFLLSPNTIRGYIEQLIPFPYKFTSLNIDYHLPITKHNTIFIFFDCAYSQAFEMYINNHYLHFFRSLLNQQNNSNIKISYGLGLQVMTPIKQIPPLRVEYGYNITNSQCFHLRIDQS
uniref:Bacterial surface antigen (D15) domain-containing protein n=1 Tax=Liagoropsis maxima TaxID=1653392 RepID=A0A1G4NVR8_9FLOR|nr:Hypothetical protein ORF_4 [Liagoropsis maxima]SCW22762.1 Hypothetical protein ORF_4 [Liagoropsis maxima]